MKKLTLAAAAIGLFISSGGLAVAQDRGMSRTAPGHEMHRHGSVPGFPGASGYAPGHRLDRDDRRGQSDRDFDRDRDIGPDLR